MIKDYYLCYYCGTFYPGDQTHECSILDIKNEDWDDYENEIREFALYSQVESEYRGEGMW